MNIRGNYITFYSKKLKDLTLTFTLISDVHFHGAFNQTLLYQIHDKVQNDTPNFICIPGDLLDQSSVLKDKNTLQELLYWLAALQEIAPVIISEGNHDISSKKHVWVNEASYKLRDKVSKLGNTILLHDGERNHRHDDSILPVSFIGFNPSFKWYHDGEKPVYFADEFNNEFNDEILNSGRLNILLTHPPRGIIYNGKLADIDFLKNVDLILTGHMHSAAMPRCLQQFSQKNHKGIIGPHGLILPKDAYGVYHEEQSEKLIVISDGITKLPLSNGVLSICDRMFAHDVYNITIKPRTMVEDNIEPSYVSDNHIYRIKKCQ